MAQYNFYGDLRLDVLYLQLQDGGGNIARMHLHDGCGMIPQLVLPNILAARKLRETLDKAIEEAEKIEQRQH